MKLKFFQLAKTLSYRSNHYQHRLGSVLVKKNRVISTGFNSLKTHQKSPHPYKSVHAEFHCIVGIDPMDLKGATIYVYREHRDGTLANARPCPSCWNMLAQADIKKVCYTQEGGYNEESF